MKLPWDRKGRLGNQAAFFFAPATRSGSFFEWTHLLSRAGCETLWRECARGREMRKQDAGFDFHRYRQLLAEAVDEPKRLALIDILVEERARDRLAAVRSANREAATVATISQVLGGLRA